MGGTRVAGSTPHTRVARGITGWDGCFGIPKSEILMKVLIMKCIQGWTLDPGPLHTSSYAAFRRRCLFSRRFGQVLSHEIACHRLQIAPIARKRLS